MSVRETNPVGIGFVSSAKTGNVGKPVLPGATDRRPCDGGSLAVGRMSPLMAGSASVMREYGLRSATAAQ
jgi:hypothetical protein